MGRPHRKHAPTRECCRTQMWCTPEITVGASLLAMASVQAPLTSRADVIRIPRIMIPVQERLASLHRHHLDTVLHRASDLAQIAANALLIDHLILVSAV